ncbi:chemotaxis protein CheW, partial [bacterium]|nr:chemotaxis protein CheW [bacterium]
DTSKYSVSKFEKSILYNNQSTYIYSSAIRSLKDERIITGGIAVVFDSTPQFHAMLDETLPSSTGDKAVFALFTNKDKQIISSTNEDFQVDSYLDIDDSFFKLKNAQSSSKIIEFDNKYYAIAAKCSNGYREYKSRVDDYKNDVLCFVFIYIGSIDCYTFLDNSTSKFLNTTKTKFTPTSVELATFYLGKKLLAVNAKNVIESIGIEELQTSIDMDKTNHFKGMVLYKDKLIAVLDIRDFVNEEITNEKLTNVILIEYDKDNIEHCVGILVSSLETVSVVEEKIIQHIQNHFLGTGTLVESLVDIKDADESKVAMLLDIKKIDEKLTKRI